MAFQHERLSLIYDRVEAGPVFRAFVPGGVLGYAAESNRRLLLGLDELEFDCGTDAPDSAIRLEAFERSTYWRVQSKIGKAGAQVVVHDFLKLKLVRWAPPFSMDKSGRVLQHFDQPVQRPRILARNFITHGHPQALDQTFKAGQRRAVASVELGVVVRVAEFSLRGNIVGLRID